MVKSRHPQQSYRGLRILVTGGAGFIGHHLVNALVEAKAEVLVVDDFSTGRAGRIPPGVDLAQIDILDADLPRSIQMWQPRFVFHLAAQASVPRGEADPEFDLRVNGLGTLRLTLAARASKVSRIVFTSSGGALYGERETPARESSPLRPESAYGVHKLLAEQYIVMSMLPHAIVRPSNVYGPGQDANGEGAVVAAFTEASGNGRGLTIHGDGAQERDFVHVEDLVDALLLVGVHGRNGIWNVSAGESTSVLELAKTIERIVGHALDVRHGPRRPGDIHLSRIDSSRLRRLGWSPRRRLADGLIALIEEARLNQPVIAQR